MSTHPGHSFTLDLPEGILRFEIPDLPGARRVTDITRIIVPFSDAVVELGTGIAKQFDKEVLCKAGCGACCRQMVPLSPPEAVIVAETVENLPMDRKGSVIDAFNRAQEKLTNAGLLTRLHDLYNRKAPHDETLSLMKEYFEMGIPCPFLTDQSCGIHPVRPSRCREYSVLSDPTFCADPFAGQVKRLPITVRLSEALSFAWASLTKTRPVIIPLIDAPFWVEANPQARDLAIEGGSAFAKSVLEFATKEANRRARDRAGGGIVGMKGGKA